MRASVLFGVAIALLFGLTVVVAARMTGFFNPTSAVKKKPPRIQVLVARSNLFEGLVITANDVMVRDLFEEEKTEYDTNQRSFMPPVPSIANFRVPIRNVAANTPLRTDFFRDFGLPNSITIRLQKREKNRQ